MSINSRVPEKWFFVDTETGAVYQWDMTKNTWKLKANVAFMDDDVIVLKRKK